MEQFDARRNYIAHSYYIVEEIVPGTNVWSPGDILTDIQLQWHDQVVKSYPCGGQTIRSRPLAKALGNKYGHTPWWKRLLLGEVCLPGPGTLEH